MHNDCVHANIAANYDATETNMCLQLWHWVGLSNDTIAVPWWLQLCLVNSTRKATDGHVEVWIMYGKII